jgi:hypothetical protein
MPPAALVTRRKRRDRGGMAFVHMEPTALNHDFPAGELPRHQLSGMTFNGWQREAGNILIGNPHGVGDPAAQNPEPRTKHQCKGGFSRSQALPDECDGLRQRLRLVSLGERH